MGYKVILQMTEAPELCSFDVTQKSLACVAQLQTSHNAAVLQPTAMEAAVIQTYVPQSVSVLHACSTVHVPFPMENESGRIVLYLCGQLAPDSPV